jgi:hypothetical protein
MPFFKSVAVKHKRKINTGRSNIMLIIALIFRKNFNRLHAISQCVTESKKEMVPHFRVDHYKEQPSRGLTQDYTKLHNQRGSRDVIRVNKSSRLIRSGNAAHFRTTTNGYKKPEVNISPGGPRE